MTAVYLLAGVVAAAAAPTPADAPPATLERRLVLMGTQLHLRVEAPDRRTALRASERIVRALEAAESRLSTWREDTELARLNRTAPGQPRPLSPALAAELAAARACWRETSGAFDPAIGALVTAWGLRTGGREPSDEELRRARAESGMDGLELFGVSETPSAIRRRSGLRIDAGGFGKGAGLEAALQALGSSGATSAALDLGGQWAFSGEPGQGRAEHHRDRWRVAVADPQDRQRAVVAFAVDGGSVATSGNSERGITVDGHLRSHLIDPRTGRPAVDFGSLTVWADNPLRADCLSTGLYVMGPDAALAWAARHPGVEVLVLTPRGEGKGKERSWTARATPRLAHRLEPLVGGLVITHTQRDNGRSAARLSNRRPWNPARLANRAISKEKYTCRP